MNKTYWGVDLGGTKVECAVLDENLELLFRERISTEREKGYSHILERISAIVQQARSTLGFSPSIIGFGTPGTSDPRTGLMKNCNSTQLNGKTLKADLMKRLNCEVLITNDANCLALSEYHLGIIPARYPDAKNIVSLIMGTGCGSGLIINGMLVNGLHGIAGEWGHNVLIDDGDSCYCGKRGCVETVISGPALEKFFHSIALRHEPMKNILSRYREGNKEDAYRLTVGRLLEQFSRAIATYINIVDPDVIIIGGGVGNTDELYSDTPDLILQHLFNDSLNTVFTKPLLGDSSGVFGAALLVKMNNTLLHA
ncbi:ROK family protein [Serratia sp. CY54717]|uniref:ROK family protein n=1 Tax=Serratia sp. CY54717 TaxID=3383637 RepID=UPI003FA15C1F